MIERLDARVDEIRKKIKGVEDKKVASEVFDKSTLLTLWELANKGAIDLLYGVIKTGKESNVFLGKGKKGEPLAVKIHRITTSDYKSMIRYMDGDYRFRGIRKSKRSIVYTWVKKEFKNLKVAGECGIAAPKPIAYKNNVLIMEFVGEDEVSSPMLRSCWLRNPEEVLNKIVEYVKKLYCEGNLVHSDLSEYNILIKDEQPVFIDFSQAVIKEHPTAQEFLKRDVANIAKFFRKHTTCASKYTDESEILSYVAECKKPRVKTRFSALHQQAFQTT
ncbi:MAG: serine protein kinase RIO [Euryarchaeota archaeon]|nr:serine protein kinase RIO [Euryarchaeota archaeon]